MKKQKKILIIATLFLFVMIGIVYATFTALTLKINTSATASASIFSVGFDDVEPFIEKSNDNIIVSAAIPTEGNDSVNVDVSGLKNPGDTATVYYTVKNFGDVDATNIFIYTGPERQLETGETPQEWISEDGVFEFSLYKTNFNGSDVKSVGEKWLAAENELRANEIGIVKIEVKLLKKVDIETKVSCTATITAEPGNLTVE